MVSVQFCAGRNRVWGGDANVERSALVHRKCRCKDISRAGARGTSDEAKDSWLGCSISQPRVMKEHVTHLVVAPGVGPTGTAQSVVGCGTQESTATRQAGNGIIRMIGSQSEADRSDEFVCRQLARSIATDSPKPLVGYGVVPELVDAADVIPELTRREVIRNFVHGVWHPQGGKASTAKARLGRGGVLFVLGSGPVR